MTAVVSAALLLGVSALAGLGVAAGLVAGVRAVARRVRGSYR